MKGGEREREREREETAIMSKWKAANPDESGFVYFTIKSGTCYLCAYLLGKAEEGVWKCLRLFYMYDTIWGFSRSTNLRSWGNLLEICWQSLVVSGDKVKKWDFFLELREICFSENGVQCNLFCYVFVCNSLVCVRYLESIATSTTQYSIDMGGIMVYDKKYESICCRSFSRPGVVKMSWHAVSGVSGEFTQGI